MFLNVIQVIIFSCIYWAMNVFSFCFAFMIFALPIKILTGNTLRYYFPGDYLLYIFFFVIGILPLYFSLYSGIESLNVSHKFLKSFTAPYLKIYYLIKGYWINQSNPNSQGS